MLPIFWEFLSAEPFMFAHGVLFGCLWTGIALIAVEALVRSRKTTERTTR